jgi:hypothetical protein
MMHRVVLLAAVAALLLYLGGRPSPRASGPDRFARASLVDPAAEYCLDGALADEAPPPGPAPVQRMVENPLALEILAGKFKEGDLIIVDLSRERETFAFRKEAAVAQPA